MSAYIPPRPHRKLPPTRVKSWLSRYHGKPCAYCGREMRVTYPNPHHHDYCPSRDHIIPRSRGGEATVVCCKGCNNAKGDMHPHAWMRWVLAEMPERAAAVRAVYATVGVDVGVRGV